MSLQGLPPWWSSRLSIHDPPFGLPPMAFCGGCILPLAEHAAYVLAKRLTTVRARQGLRGLRIDVMLGHRRRSRSGSVVVIAVVRVAMLWWRSTSRHRALRMLGERLIADMVAGGLIRGWRRWLLLEPIFRIVLASGISLTCSRRLGPAFNLLPPDDPRFLL